MITAAKMRYFKIRGGGEYEDEGMVIDEITICNAHLNYRTAKAELQEGGRNYNKCFNLLAGYLARFSP